MPSLNLLYNLILLNSSRIFPFMRQMVLFRPSWVEIAVTTRCSSRCLTCNYWKQENADMPLELLKEILTQAKEMGVSNCLFYGGEPLLYGRLDEAVDFAKGLKFNLDLCTNGLQKPAQTLLNKFDAVSVSIDGLGEVNDRLRGINGSFDKAVSFLADLRRLGVKHNVAITLSKYNLGTVSSLIEHLIKEEVRFSVQLADNKFGYFEKDSWALGPEEKGELKILVKYLLKIKKENPGLLLNNRYSLSYIPAYFAGRSLPCYLAYSGRLWINWNGDIHVCQGYPAMGNIEKNSLNEIIKTFGQTDYFKCDGCSCSFSYSANADIVFRLKSLLGKI